MRITQEMVTHPHLIEHSGPTREPAADMADLAALVRTLMDVRDRRDTRVRLGGNLFDVVITGAGPQAYHVVAQMDVVQGGCGPVIEDPDSEWLYWLVPPGASSRWAPHPHAVCLGAPRVITLPSLSSNRPPGPFWLRRSASDRLVPAGPLREALTQFSPEPTPHAALAAQLGTTP
ncbi:hypothetical protein [Streptomyces agglomeratus]|uniref:hypothetical protein n=1 Tax=Streptomyces agglomeratus TaxID=285458 RepID=UPI00210ED571|nr:hypothetical protein [Streptomyces agglomeratus]